MFMASPTTSRNIDPIREYATSFVKTIIDSSLDTIQKEKDRAYFTREIPQEEENIAIDTFLQKVDEEEGVILDDFEESPLSDFDGRFLKQTHLGWCLCASYPTSTRLAIHRNFREKIRGDNELCEIANRSQELFVLFVGGGLLLQELLQVKSLLEETKEGGVLKNVKRLGIILKDPDYEIFKVVYESALKSFLAQLSRFSHSYQVQVQSMILPRNAQNSLPGGVMLLSAVDVVDDSSDIFTNVQTYVALHAYRRTLCSVARCFITYRYYHEKQTAKRSETMTILADPKNRHVLAVYDLFQYHASIMPVVNNTLRLDLANKRSVLMEVLERLRVLAQEE